MNPEHLAIAAGPLALYLCWVGLRGLARRPRLISGGANVVEVAFAVLGLLMIGPLPLFLPQHSVARFGVYIWFMLLALYVLVTISIVLLSRPRLIVNNITLDVLRPLTAEIVSRMDDQCAWAGDTVALPRLGLQIQFEGQPLLRTVTLTAGGEQRNLAAWDHFRRELAGSLRKLQVGPHPWSVAWILAGLLLACWPAYQLWTNHHQIVRAFTELLAM